MRPAEPLVLLPWLAVAAVPVLDLESLLRAAEAVACRGPCRWLPLLLVLAGVVMALLTLELAPAVAARPQPPTMLPPIEALLALLTAAAPMLARSWPAMSARADLARLISSRRPSCS